MDILIVVEQAKGPPQPIPAGQGEKGCEFDKMAPSVLPKRRFFNSVNFVKMLPAQDVPCFTCLDFPRYNPQNSIHSHGP